jgi:hypothetical protein
MSVVTTKKGPSVVSPDDPKAFSALSTQENPDAVAALEWSNLLSTILRDFSGTEKQVECVFSKDVTDGDTQIPDEREDQKTPRLEPLMFNVRAFFEKDTGVISRDLAKPGQLTQGLCSPWQNDYRECSCYYWASARPDYVNVEPSPTGGSVGDNWLQKKRTKDYVPDDYKDSRLVLYKDLFENWEACLRVPIGGNDRDDEDDE